MAESGTGERHTLSPGFVFPTLSQHGRASLQDVSQTAVGIVMAAEGCSEAAVRARFTSLAKERRIQKDVW